MPIDLSDNMEMKSDLLDYSEELLRELDLTIPQKGDDKSKENGRKDRQASVARRNEKEKKEIPCPSDEEGVYLQIRLSGREMFKARLVSMSRKCTLTDLFADLISKEIDLLFSSERKNIERMINSVLNK